MEKKPREGASPGFEKLPMDAGHPKHTPELSLFLHPNTPTHPVLSVPANPNYLGSNSALHIWASFLKLSFALNLFLTHLFVICVLPKMTIFAFCLQVSYYLSKLEQGLGILPLKPRRMPVTLQAFRPCLQHEWTVKKWLQTGKPPKRCPVYNEAFTVCLCTTCFVFVFYHCDSLYS